VDFTGLARHARPYVQHGPDAPFGAPIDEEELAEPDTTGRVMQFVVEVARSTDTRRRSSLAPTGARPDGDSNVRSTRSSEICVRSTRTTISCSAGRRSPVQWPRQCFPRWRCSAARGDGSGILLWATHHREPGARRGETWEIHNFTAAHRSTCIWGLQVVNRSRWAGPSPRSRRDQSRTWRSPTG
jgi:hypothetical protein